MLLKVSFVLAALAVLASAQPTIEQREPHHGGTHTFGSITMKSTCGKCLAAQPAASGANANANPVQLQACDSSQGQKWTVITEGRKHALIINSLTNECLNFDSSKQAGQQVALVSCGQNGQSNNKRHHHGQNGTIPKGVQVTIEPLDAQNQCVTVKDEKTLESSACKESDKNQLFTLA